MAEITNYVKRLIIFTYDRFASLFAIFLAFALRYNNFSADGAKFIWMSFDNFIIISFSVKILCLHLFKVSRGMWRFSSLPDLKQIILMATSSILITSMANFFFNRLASIPRSVVLFDWVLTIFLLGGARLLYRIWREKTINRKNRKAILIGAGNAAEKLLREYQKGSFDFEIIGIFDDDKSKVRRTMQGIAVVGTTADIKKYIEHNEIEKIIIAIPSANSQFIRNILNVVGDRPIEVKTLPSTTDIIDGKVTISQLRAVNIEDLLGRDPIILDSTSVKNITTGKRILVTGAGGSIGSELVRQLARFEPAEIFLLDTSEYFLFHLENELKENFPKLKFKIFVADIKDITRLDHIFQDHKPELVYHAAAYKHVPMMETNSAEAIKTNVGGTKNVLELAMNYRVQKFVLISTDKAVNPTSVMGATKKVAELICRYYGQTQENTDIVTVRFGNVLGSNGSVVPIFMEQIKKGGPITITDKEMTRYFMSIPEASQLVLQSSAISKNGQIMVLDMGEPVKIYDLARQVIRLSGLEVGKDIEIVEIGMRPGEKLYEELFYAWEELETTAHQKLSLPLHLMSASSFLLN